MQATGPGGRGFELAESVGRAIAAAAARCVEEALSGEPEPGIPTPLGAHLLEVELPPYRYPIGRHLRLSPVVMSLLHERRTFLHLARIGDLVLVGMPCDFSGVLALEIDRRVEGRGIAAVTSFNGDYVGYVLPRPDFEIAHYETRTMNFFGPWAGEYLADLAATAALALLEDPGAR
jgi:hypothetical protein